MKKIMLILAATAFLGAQAYAFTGSIAMGGTTTTSTPTSTTVHVAFGSDWTVSAVPPATGAYAAVAPGTAVSYTDFTYNKNTLAITAPAAPFTLWSFSFGGNTYTFDLNSPLDAAFNSSGSFSINGNGTAFINGGSGSNGFWSISGTKKTATFTFNSSSVTSVVPDGGSAVALLGIALAGIEGARRMIRARKA